MNKENKYYPKYWLLVAYLLLIFGITSYVSYSTCTVGEILIRSTVVGAIVCLLVVPIFWVYISVKENGIYLKQHLGIFTGKTRFVNLSNIEAGYYTKAPRFEIINLKVKNEKSITIFLHWLSKPKEFIEYLEDKNILIYDQTIRFGGNKK